MKDAQPSRYEAARQELELLCAETTKLIGDICHARRCLADTVDLQRGVGSDAAQVSFPSSGTASGTANEVWRCEALGVRLDRNHLAHLKFEVAQHTDAGPMGRFATSLTC